MKSVVKFWYSARNFDSCSKGEIKFENGSVLRVNIPPRIKISLPKLFEDVVVERDVFEKMHSIISRNINNYKNVKSSSKDQFEHGLQELFNVMSSAKSMSEAVELVKNFELV